MTVRRYSIIQPTKKLNCPVRIRVERALFVGRDVVEDLRSRSRCETSVTGRDNIYYGAVFSKPFYLSLLCNRYLQAAVQRTTFAFSQWDYKISLFTNNLIDL